ncbi:MAG: 30S ribosomal protein S15, partial [Methylococcales bacterium]|nr:30S ribosomal protein S15 [Methylococcales bacterium]
MPFTTEQKQAVIEEYRLSDTDTGSAEVQVALLTAHITHLTPHFAAHKKDN